MLIYISGAISSITGVFLVYKTYFSVPSYKEEDKYKDKVVVITGATSGIGKNLAYQLAQRDVTLILACKDKTKCHEKQALMTKKSGNKNIYCSELDLADPESIRNFVQRLKSKMNKVDVLIHNAGVKCGKKREVTNNLIEKQLQINVLSRYLLTKLLAPIMSESATKTDKARVISLVCPSYVNGEINMSNVNSQIYDKRKAFNQSQLMNVLLQKRLSDYYSKNIVFYSVNPGITFTDFHFKENYNNFFVSRWLFKLINVCIMRNPWQAAQTPLMLAVDKNLGDSTNLMYQDLQPIEIDEVGKDEKNCLLVEALCEKWTAETPNQKLNIKDSTVKVS